MKLILVLLSLFVHLFNQVVHVFFMLFCQLYLNLLDLPLLVAVMLLPLLV
jgi:hypothetical protein